MQNERDEGSRRTGNDSVLGTPESFRKDGAKEKVAHMGDRPVGDSAKKPEDTGRPEKADR